MVNELCGPGLQVPHIGTGVICRRMTIQHSGDSSHRIQPNSYRCRDGSLETGAFGKSVSLLATLSYGSPSVRTDKPNAHIIPAALNELDRHERTSLPSFWARRRSCPKDPYGSGASAGLPVPSGSSDAINQ